MPRFLEKIERRLGEKLLIKGERCAGPKCAAVRRAYIPGAHGRVRGKRRRGLSEYGSLLKEKQILRFIYGLDDQDIERYSREAVFKRGIFASIILSLLESRLDNVVFRLGFTESRRAARQAVSHGHIMVDGKTVRIPSYRLSVGELVSIKERALGFGAFLNLEIRIKKYEPPKWLELDRGKKTAKVIGVPDVGDSGITIDVAKIKEFYSR